MTMTAPTDRLRQVERPATSCAILMKYSSHGGLLVTASVLLIPLYRPVFTCNKRKSYAELLDFLLDHFKILLIFNI